MQALFLMWCGKELVRVEVLHTVSGINLNGTARALMDEMWNNEGRNVDFCVIYLISDRRLVLVAEER